MKSRLGSGETETTTMSEQEAEGDTVYQCAVCPPTDPYRNDEVKHVKRHVTASTDERHEGKSGDDHMVIDEVDRLDEESLEANDRCDHDGDERVEVSSGNGSYSGPASGIDVTGQHISERPVKRSAGDEVTDVETEDKVLIALTDDQVLDILCGKRPNKQMREDIYEQIKGGGQ